MTRANSSETPHASKCHSTTTLFGEFDKVQLEVVVCNLHEYVSFNAWLISPCPKIQADGGATLLSADEGSNTQPCVSSRTLIEQRGEVQKLCCFSYCYLTINTCWPLYILLLPQTTQKKKGNLKNLGKVCAQFTTSLISSF